MFVIFNYFCRESYFYRLSKKYLCSFQKLRKTKDSLWSLIKVFGYLKQFFFSIKRVATLL